MATDGSKTLTAVGYKAEIGGSCVVDLLDTIGGQQPDGRVVDATQYDGVVIEMAQSTEDTVMFKGGEYRAAFVRHAGNVGVTRWSPSGKEAAEFWFPGCEDTAS